MYHHLIHRLCYTVPNYVDINTHDTVPLYYFSCMGLNCNVLEFFAMKALQKVLSKVVLILIVSCSRSDTKSISKDGNCSNNSICPTWYICDEQKLQCKCGDSHKHTVVCDDENLCSAVLN